MPTNRTDYMREYARDLRRKDRDEVREFDEKDVTWKDDIGYIIENNQQIPVIRRGVCCVCQIKFIYNYGQGRKRTKCNTCRSPLKSQLGKNNGKLLDHREKMFGDSLLLQNDKWISLDHTRPDFYDIERNVWIELKLALKARFWMYTCKSKHFPNLFFNSSVDNQIKVLLEIFLPLEVIVLDAVTGELLTKRLFKEKTK